MYHSITIGNKNTFRDWHLVSPSRPLVVPPQPKFNYVDILGKSGSLDYTEALTKIPRYSDREGSWEFVVLNPGDVDDLLYSEPIGSYNWVKLYNELLQYLHGRYFDNIVLEDDPDYTYRGRIWLNEWRSDAGWSRIVMNYRLEPFKYSKKQAKIHTIEFTNRTITYSDNVNIHLNRSHGLAPTPLHIMVTTDDTDASHHTHGCRAAYSNSELNIQKRWTFNNVVGQDISDIVFYDHENNIYTSYTTFNQDREYKDCPVSNQNGGNCVLSFGCFSDQETMYGPLTIRYWWEEARL